MECGASSMIFIRKDAVTGDPKVGGWERKEDRGKELVEGRKGMSVSGVPGLCWTLWGQILFLITATRQLWHLALPPAPFYGCESRGSGED